MEQSTAQLRVLFVCLGNICRSPMAEGLFLHLIEKKGLSGRFVIDSAGTSGHHTGELADHRMRKTAEGHGVRLPSRARQVRRQDFQEFDYILAMDASNLQHLQRMQAEIPSSRASLHLMRNFESGARNLGVPDPYYGGQDGFEEVFQILERATRGFLTHIRAEHSF